MTTNIHLICVLNKCSHQLISTITFPAAILQAPFYSMKQTGSENIGGMSVTLDIMSRTEGASYEEYFSNRARVWCRKVRPEFRQMLLSVDVHGPAILRANMPPGNFSEWYKTFGVKDTDQMYLPEDKRIIIWY